MSILQLLLQLVFRLTFGVALSMAATSSRHVSAGYFRVHLWVLMGLNTLASLAIYTQPEILGDSVGSADTVLGLALTLAVGSYVGSVIWLYERAGVGFYTLLAIMVGGCLAAVLASPTRQAPEGLASVRIWLDVVSSGWVLGGTLAAMFLGHWYLNTPTMELLPLKRLVLLMCGALAVRGACSGAGLVLQVQESSTLNTAFWIFIALRWLAGLIGPLLLAAMTWRTLQIPNTQSATGILYASVILTLIGELTSQFLSADAHYPL